MPKKKAKLSLTYGKLGEAYQILKLSDATLFREDSSRRYTTVVRRGPIWAAYCESMGIVELAQAIRRNKVKPYSVWRRSE